MIVSVLTLIDPLALVIDFLVLVIRWKLPVALWKIPIKGGLGVGYSPGLNIDSTM